MKVAASPRKVCVIVLRLGLFSLLLTALVVGCQPAANDGDDAGSEQGAPPQQMVPGPSVTPPPADPEDFESPEKAPAENKAGTSDASPSRADTVAASNSDKPANFNVADGGSSAAAAAKPAGSNSGEPDSPAKPGAADMPDAAGGESAPKYQVLIKHKDFTKGRDGALRVSFDDIDLEKILGMKKTTPNAPELMPDWLKNLRGQRIRLRGYMLPTSVFQQTGNSFFVLTRDTGACCFGPQPTIYYLVEVQMKKGETVDYIENRPFDVVGTFDIEISQLEETGEVYRLYQLKDASVFQ